MDLLLPIWLALVAPWLAAAAWLLRGSRRRASVPFLALWQGPVTGPRTERRPRAPPIAVGAALLASLLAILAAARPVVGRRSGAPAGGRVTMVVDRGIMMSGRGAKELRYREAAAEACAALRERFPGGTEVRLIVVPGEGERTVGLSEVRGIIESTAPTALDTRKTLPEVVARQAGEPAVLVVTDQLVETAGNAGMIRIAPAGLLEDIAVVRVSVRERPTTQAMIRIRNQSAQARTTLAVSSGGARIEREIELPRAPGERNFFFDLPRLGDEVLAELPAVRDGVEADHRAWALREGTARRIEPKAKLPAALGRLIDAYQGSRPAAQGAGGLAVVADVAQLPGEEAGVVIEQGVTEISGAEMMAADHALTRHVRWGALPRPLRAGGAPPAGWEPVVRAGDAALVAVSPGEPRRVWVGFDAPRWEAEADYVIFWTNVFDWAEGGSGGERGFAGHPLAEWTREWKSGGAAGSGVWPGVYGRADGASRAFNAPDVLIPNNQASDWRRRVSALGDGPAAVEITPPLLVACVACLLICAATWRG